MFLLLSKFCADLIQKILNLNLHFVKNNFESCSLDVTAFVCHSHNLSNL